MDNPRDNNSNDTNVRTKFLLFLYNSKSGREKSPFPNDKN